MSQVTRRSALVAAVFAIGGGVAGFVAARNSDAAKTTNDAYANAYEPPKPTPQSTGTGTGTGTGGAGTSAPAGPKQPTAKPLAALADVPADGGIILKKQGVVITRGSGDTVHAFTTTCPHQGCTVFRVQSGTIDCPCHGSKFDVATGKVVAGPAPSGLDPIPVTISAGKIYPA